MSAVYELELLTCKFCPGVLKPDVFRVQKVRAFAFIVASSAIGPTSSPKGTSQRALWGSERLT
jgi:hypothetical protein